MKIRSIVPLVVLTLGVPAFTSCSSGTNSGSSTSVDAGGADAGGADATTFDSCPDSARTAGRGRESSAAAKRLRIVTSVAPITSIVANIVGDLADVEGVVPEGTNSHTFEPKPSVATTMAKADLLFVNGLKLEDPTLEIAEQAGDSLEIVELGTLTITPDQYIYDFSFPKEGGKPNPHLWTNPPMAKCYAAIVASVVSKADPQHATQYQANFDRYAARVDELDELMKQATASVDKNQRKLLTYHDAYAYFAEHYGWDVIGAVQVSSFEDPTPKEVASLIEQVKSEKVKAVFGSEVFPSKVLAQIAAEAGTAYVDKLRDDDLPGAPGEPDHSFLALLRFDFATLVGALGGDPSALVAFDASDTAPDNAVYPQ